MIDEFDCFRAEAVCLGLVDEDLLVDGDFFFDGDLDFFFLSGLFDCFESSHRFADSILRFMSCCISERYKINEDNM